MASFFDLEKKKKKPGEVATGMSTPTATTPTTTPQGKSFFSLEEKYKPAVQSLQAQRVKPSQSNHGQIKPVDQVEQESGAKPWEEMGFVDKAKATISEIDDTIGTHLKKTGAALGDMTPASTKSWEDQSILEKGKSALMEVPATITRPILNSGIKASQGAVGVAGFVGIPGSKEASAAIQKYRTDYDKGIKPQSYDENDNIFDNPALLVNPEYLSRTVIEQLPNLAFMMKTKGIGEGVLELGGAFNERMVRAQEQGENADAMDRLYAGSIGIINGALGKLGFDALFEKNPAIRAAISERIGEGVSRAVAAVGATGVEMGTEYIQEVIPEIATKVMFDEGGSWQEVLAQAHAQGKTAAGAAGVISAPVAGLNYGTNPVAPGTPAPQTPGVSVEGAPAVIEEEKGYKAPDRVQELVDAIETGDQEKVDEVSSSMSAKEISQAQQTFQKLQEQGVQDEEVNKTIQAFGETVGTLQGKKVQAIEETATAILEGQPVEANLSVSDLDKVKQIVSKAAETLDPEARAGIDERLATLNTDTLDGVNDARSLDNEQNPFFTSQDENEVSSKFDEETSSIRETIQELSEQKSEYLMRKNETQEPAQRREIQSTINALDEERKSLEADLKVFERQANAKNLVLIQSTIDKIRERDPEFSLARSIDNRWSAADYKRHLATLPVPRGTSEPQSNKTPKVEPKKAVSTKKEEKVNSESSKKEPVKFSGNDIAKEAVELGSDQGGISDFTKEKISQEDYSVETVSISELRKQDKDLDEYLNSGEVREFDGEPNAMNPIVSSDGEILDGYNRIAQAVKDGKQEIDVLKGYSKPKEGDEKLLAQQDAQVENEDDDFEVNFQMFNVSQPIRKENGQFAGSTKGESNQKPPKPRKRRVSKDEQIARDQMTDVIAETLFDEDNWARIIEKTGEGTTDFEDFSVLDAIKEGLEKPGMKVDFENIRLAYEVLARYGIPVSENLGTPMSSFSVSRDGSTQRKLIPVHNISEAKLRFADRIGGLSNPSMAVINPETTGFESFGDISLIPRASILEGEKTHLADAYSPRFPTVHSSMPYEDFKRFKEEMQPFYAEIGDDARTVEDNNDNVIREIENNPAVVLRFLKEKGIKPSEKGQHYYHSQIEENKLDGDFQDFLDTLYKKFNVKEQMFAGYTYSGRRRYKDLGVEEASALMSKERSEGFNYGLGSYRSMLAPVKRGLDGIRKEAGRLLSREDFEKVRDEYDEVLNRIQESLAPYAVNKDSNSFIEYDRQNSTIGAILAGERDAWTYFRQKFPEAPSSVVQEIEDFKKKLKKMPTEYFETKFKRPVYLNEFEKAIVPEGTSEQVKGILKKHGIEVVEYKKEKKQEELKRLLEDELVSFNLQQKAAESRDTRNAVFSRGIDNVRVQLLSRVKEGSLTERQYQEMSAALDLFSPLVKNMALNTGLKSELGTVDGVYEWVSNTISLFEMADNSGMSQTFYHEIGHHVSRYIPREMLLPLYQQFAKERSEFLDSNPDFVKADKMPRNERLSYYASNNPGENYKFFDFDEWLAETIRTKTTEEIQKTLGVEDESFAMAVVRYMKQLLAIIKEVITRFRGKDAADEAFKLLTAGEELAIVNQLGLEYSIVKSGDQKKQMERRRKELRRLYDKQVGKMNPATALAFEKAFNKEVSEESLIEAADILIRADMKASNSGSFSVRKLPETKYGGAFVSPDYVEEYRRIVDEQALIIEHEKEIVDQEKILEEVGELMPDDMGSQYDSFKRLLKDVRDKAGKEVLSSGDVRQVENYLVGKKGWNASEVYNMFYDFSGERNDDDVLDYFRSMLMREDPGLLVGRKVAKELDLVTKVKNAKERVEAGESEFSEQYSAYEKEKEAILKKSQEQFTEDDVAFINASKELKAELHKVRRDREKAGLIRKGATLGKAIKKGQFAQRIKDFTDRKRKVRYAKEFFGLSETQFRKIGGNTPVQYITPEQFTNFMNRLQEAAANEAERSFFINAIYQSIKEKQLKKTDNLRQAWGMPTIPNMTLEQLKQFGNALDATSEGDTFLTRRQIQTVDNTELSGIKTLNEARERLAERMKVPVTSLQNLSATEFDRFRFDTALAEQNPFYEVLVDDTNREFLTAEAKVYEIRNTTNRLLKAARKSRPRSFIEHFIPSDERIFNYLESTDKATLAADMTEAELEAAEFIREYYEGARDYLINRKMMERYRENYITHVRKRFLETWKDNGFFKAIKSVFDQYKEDETTFNILDGDTGNILPMEKFFQFSMKRTGGLDPTKNVASAFMAYVGTFEKKRAFDSIIPKMEIYADALSNEKTTPQGLLFDRSLKAFLREWINNKKGRRNNLGGMVKQGGKIDLLLRFGNALVTVIDLGFSLPTGLASQVGEQTTNFVQMGAKNWARGRARMLTKKGRTFAKKYESFTRENPWKTLAEASDNIGDTVSKTMFVLFRDASWRANRHFLLGSLTKEEWKNGEVSPERLALMKRDMGRWRVIEGAESVMGATSAGKVGTKYKSWAVPIMRTLVKDLTTLAKNPKQFNSREGQELFRVTVITALVTMAMYALVGDEDKKMSEMSFLEKLEAKILRDAFSLTSSLDPTLWASTPRLIDFTYKLGTGMKQLIMLEKYKTSGEWGEKGSLKGDNTLRRAVTPMVVKQFIGGK